MSPLANWTIINGLLFCGFASMYLIRDTTDEDSHDGEGSHRKVSLTPVPRLLGKTYVVIAAVALAVLTVRSASGVKFTQAVAELSLLIALETGADGWAGHLVQYDWPSRFSRWSGVEFVVVPYLLFALSTLWWAAAWFKGLL